MVTPLAPHRAPTTVGILFGQDVELLELAVPPRVFGIDLSSRGGPRFEVVTAAERPGSVRTTGGIELVPTHPIGSLASAGIVVVPGWRDPSHPTPVAPEVLDALRDAYDDGAIVVGLCLGAFVLAEAGLLEGRSATTHWRHTDTLAARYPSTKVAHDVLYVDEGQVITSAGSAAGIDACLHILRREHGAEAANAAARALVVAPHRAGGQAQFIEYPVPPVRDGDAVSDAMGYALDRLDDAGLDINAIAAHVHLSRRTFDRRFRMHTGLSALQWLLQQRVLRAQHLLETTTLDIDAVARRCGFSDAVALRPHFRRIVGVPPQAYRASFRVA
jgi:transcriptional regulator GlxA family with amidase domain